MKHHAELTAMRDMLNNMFTRLRHIEADTPLCEAVGHIGCALTHIESAKGCVGSAITAMEEGQ